MNGNNRKKRLLWAVAMVARKLMARNRWIHACMVQLARVMSRFSARVNHVVMTPFLEKQGEGEKRGQRGIPSWVEDEMSELVGIEPELCTAEDGKKRVFEFYVIPARSEPGRVYAEAWDEVAGQRFTHILIGPWVARGGADLGILHHLEQLTVSPDVRVLLITTENAPSPWMGRVGPSVSKLELGAIACDLAFDDVVIVLTRLILQLQPDVIHVINSRAAWEMIARHGLAVRQFSRIYASLYCDDRSPDGAVTGYARTYLRNCIAHLDKVICDNSIIPQQWCRDFGISEDKFAVVYFPVKLPEIPVFSPLPGVKRVLWAGRFAAQKNPGLLASIAAQTPDVQYDVYGADSSHGIKFPKNVEIKGFFEEFERLPHAEYGCYLNTSLWDGLPNVLLEATASGLPIVSTAVGGIPDFLNHENAFLIEDVADIEAACEQIRLAISDHALARQRWGNAHAVLSARHTPASMLIALREVDGYLEPALSKGAVEEVDVMFARVQRNKVEPIVEEDKKAQRVEAVANDDVVRKLDEMSKNLAAIELAKLIGVHGKESLSNDLNGYFYRIKDGEHLWFVSLAASIDSGVYRDFSRRHIKSKMLDVASEGFINLVNEKYLFPRQREMTSTHGIKKTFRFFSDAERQAYVEHVCRLMEYIKDFSSMVCLGYGGVLGAARNGRLIDHDDDIDVIVGIDKGMASNRGEAIKEMIEFLKPEFSASPSHVDHFFNVWLPGRHCDVFVGIVEEDGFFSVPGPGGGLPVAEMFPASSIELEGVECLAPANIEKHLEWRYGKDWMVPDANFCG